MTNLFGYFVKKSLGVQRIVITGAPGTGKTVVIKSLEKLGFQCFHEVIRTMTATAKQTQGEKPQVSNPLVFVDDPLLFNKTLLSSRKEDFLKAVNSGEQLCFYDRGLPDVLAYMDYFGQEYDDSFIETCNEHCYDQLFIMPPWEAIYMRDNERLESFEEANQLHGHLFDTYQRFGYQPIIVPKTSVEKRTKFIIDTIDK